MASQSVTTAGSMPKAGLAAGIFERFRSVLPRFASAPGLLFRASAAAEEVVVGHCGIVEIHQTLPGWLLETCVKGEPDQARATALRRLANYVRDRNRASVRLHAVKPLIQVEDARGRWRVTARHGSPSRRG